MLRQTYPCSVDDRDSLRVDNNFDRPADGDWNALKMVMTDGADRAKLSIYLSVEDTQKLYEQLGTALTEYREGR